MTLQQAVVEHPLLTFCLAGAALLIVIDIIRGGGK